MLGGGRGYHSKQKSTRAAEQSRGTEQHSSTAEEQSSPLTQRFQIKLNKSQSPRTRSAGNEVLPPPPSPLPPRRDHVTVGQELKSPRD